ncbi:MAG: MarR family transcriptional regulator [Gemmatimonadaceae bacterium]|nr:MarR family transcriptional regulator [Gemmatimonadaceae bacterium]
MSDQIDAVRRFNRFYTRLIGALDEAHLQSGRSLAEVRILYELAHRTRTTATELAQALTLDAGYLSRLLARLTDQGLLQREPVAHDARQSILGLTANGVACYERLDGRARDAVAAILDPLSAGSRAAVLDAMRAIHATLAPDEVAHESSPVVLRSHRAGDMGAIVSRQATLYFREYGWNASYESLVARIAADFLQSYDPARERCWIAERDGEMVGSVFVVKHPERAGVARLRLLYVEPSARGLGVGRTLVAQCTSFARTAGYHTLTLWTNSVLVSARRIYEQEGYRLLDEETHHSFGHDLIGQRWERPLRAT